MLSKPSLVVSLANCQPQCKFFKPHCIAAVLGINAVDLFLSVIYIDAPLVYIDTYNILVHPTGRMQKTKAVCLF